MDTFGNRLNTALKIRNMKQVELAEKLNINRATINNYIKEKYEPNRNRLKLIAKILNINPTWLLGYDEPMEKPQSPQTIEDIDFTGIDRIAAHYKGEEFSKEALETIKDFVDYVKSKKNKEK